MRLTKSLLFGISALTLATGAAFAGEDSTHRWHGTGPEFHESAGGLQLFSDSEAVGSEQFAEPNDSLERDRLSMYEPDVIYIYPMQVSEYYILVPSVDTETPQG